MDYSRNSLCKKLTVWKRTEIQYITLSPISLSCDRVRLYVKSILCIRLELRQYVIQLGVVFSANSNIIHSPTTTQNILKWKRCQSESKYLPVSATGVPAVVKGDVSVRRFSDVHYVSQQLSGIVQLERLPLEDDCLAAGFLDGYV